MTSWREPIQVAFRFSTATLSNLAGFAGRILHARFSRRDSSLKINPAKHVLSRSADREDSHFGSQHGEDRPVSPTTQSHLLLANLDGYQAVLRREGITSGMWAISANC